MARSVQGFINKHHRLLLADAKISQEPGRYDRTIIFRKGRRRGVLAVWVHRMEWTVFADEDYGSHVDWNDPDSTCLNSLGTPVTLLAVLSRLNEHGFLMEKEYLQQ